jgi:nicotinamide mononucleotide transporter
MIISNWISDNYIEVFGAIAGIIYVFLEIRQNIWLWPVGIVTSTVYILVFFTSKFYADMSLQGYYLIISVMGWYWWRRAQGTGLGAQGTKAQGHNGATAEEERERRGESETDYRPDSYREPNTEYRLPNTSDKPRLLVTRLKMKTGLVLGAVFVFLYTGMWLILLKLTDSPVPEWDAFITSLSIVATWMLARKIYEHWYLWIIVNFVSAVLFMTRGLYPTVVLYLVYGVMSFVGLVAWKKTILK